MLLIAFIFGQNEADSFIRQDDHNKLSCMRSTNSQIVGYQCFDISSLSSPGCPLKLNSVEKNAQNNEKQFKEPKTLVSSNCFRPAKFNLEMK